MSRVGEFDPAQLFEYLAANPGVMAGFAAMMTAQQQKGSVTPNEMPGTSSDEIHHKSHSSSRDTQHRSKTITLTTQGKSAAAAPPCSTAAPLDRFEPHAPPYSSSHAPRHSSPSGPRNNPTTHKSSPTPQRGCSYSRSDSHSRSHSRSRHRPRDQPRPRSPASSDKPNPPLQDDAPEDDENHDNGSNDEDDAGNDGNGDTTSRHPHKFPYSEMPTSYKLRTNSNGKRARGGRVQNANGKIVYTFIEKLVTRHKKWDYSRGISHPFGQKHGCYFNPYAVDLASPTAYIHIAKDPNVPLHEAIGLRTDMEFWSLVRRTVRKVVSKRRPRSVVLEPGKKLTWSHFSSAGRRDIYKDCYKELPFLQHFVDKTGQDCWAVAAIAQQYLQNAGRTGKGRGPSRGRDDDKDEDEDEDEDGDSELDEDTVGEHPKYHNDYKENMLARQANSDTGPKGSCSRRAGASNVPRSQVNSSCARPTTSGQPQPQPANRSHPRSDNTQTASTLHRSALPPQPTEHNIRRANKLAAADEAQNEPKDRQIPKTTIQPSKPAARSTTKGKNKQCKEQQEENKRVQDYDEGANMELDETVRRDQVQVGITLHRNAPQAMAPKPVPKVSAAKQNKSMAASKKRKVLEPASSDEEPFKQQEEPPAKRPTVRPRMRPPPPPESETSTTPLSRVKRMPQVSLPFPESTSPFPLSQQPRQLQDPLEPSLALVLLALADKKSVFPQIPTVRFARASHRDQLLFHPIRIPIGLLSSDQFLLPLYHFPFTFVVFVSTGYFSFDSVSTFPSPYSFSL
ncbi:hypothetical protein BDV93DRAFT_564240 [Ceratobasidium sp. AG-I]|nr:hypothetical protein BDV93DRAFT_564240 [Ceratobasidium sp. AG-I]